MNTRLMGLALLIVGIVFVFFKPGHVNSSEPHTQYVTLRVIVVPAEGGSVRGFGITCPSDCDQSKEINTPFTLTARAGQGYRFSHWSGDVNAAVNPITFTMDDDKLVYANFEQVEAYLPVVSAPQATPSTLPNDGTSTTLLTVHVTSEGDRPVSVFVNLSSLGGNASQMMHDDGTSGDSTPGDRIYSIQTTASPAVSVGEKALLVTAKDQAGHTGSNYITLAVVNRCFGTVAPQGTNTCGFTNAIAGQTLTITFFLTGRAHQLLQNETCSTTLTVRDPSGQPYRTEPMDTTPRTITIPNAQAGTYTNEIANSCTTPSSFEINTTGGGIGLVAGRVKDSPSQRDLSGVLVTTDTGGIALTLSGDYVMVAPAGISLVSAAALSYELGAQPNVVLNAGGTVTVDFELTPVPVNAKEIGINATSTPPVGNPITISFEATGESAPLQYKFWQASGYQTPGYGNWQLLRDWSTGNTLSWTPPRGGHYVIVAYVTDDTATGGYHQVGLSIATQGNSAHPIMISGLTSDFGYPQPKGAPVDLSTTASGGGGPLSYRYWKKKEPGGNWSIIRDYTGSNSCTWTPNESGIYIVVVWVTDDTSVAEPPIAGMTCTISE